MSWLALDIGGANIKAADGLGFAESCGFALWQHAHQLAGELRAVLATAPGCDHVAVTMTGELADCFAGKAEGVQFILDAVAEAVDGRHTRVYLTDGSFVAPAIAAGKPLLAASSNWHALARFCGRFAPAGRALLLDVGSTTTDILPLQDGRPAGIGQTDIERLLAGELVYTGVERSPVCALVQQATYRGQRCRVAQELFATTRDVYLVLGDGAEDADDHATADHGPATIVDAIRRLGRTLCADRDQFQLGDAVALAKDVAQAQLSLLCQAAGQVLARSDSPIDTLLLSGHGDFLARRMINQLGLTGRVMTLSTQLGPSVSRCAPAHALAVLAHECLDPR